MEGWPASTRGTSRGAEGRETPTTNRRLRGRNRPPGLDQGCSTGENREERYQRVGFDDAHAGGDQQHDVVEVGADPQAAHPARIMGSGVRQRRQRAEHDQEEDERRRATGSLYSTHPTAPPGLGRATHRLCGLRSSREKASEKPCLLFLVEFSINSFTRLVENLCPPRRPILERRSPWPLPGSHGAPLRRACARRLAWDRLNSCRNSRRGASGSAAFERPSAKRARRGASRPVTAKEIETIINRAAVPVLAKLQGLPPYVGCRGDGCDR